MGRDSSGTLQSVVRGELSDSAGLVRFDTIPPGTYGFVVRKLGFAVLRRVVEVRPGQSDTVHVTLATALVCLSNSAQAT